MSKRTSSEQATRRVIMDGPIHLVRDLLEAHDVALGVDLDDAADDNAIWRERVLETLRTHRSPALELDCLRIVGLTEDKGETSLATIAAKRLDHDEYTAFDATAGALARSIWTRLHHEAVFEMAESFHVSRRHRDRRRFYDAFEVEPGASDAWSAAAIDRDMLATRVKDALDLRADCRISALDLPKTEAHHASILLTLRHGGARSSVFDHKDNGDRERIDLRPQNEATLIYTPLERLLEVCDESPAVRYSFAEAFARHVLGQDLTTTPLTWKRYNLSRFRRSLRLEPPDIPGVLVSETKLTEIEVRLGSWKRKLTLKVAREDDISAIGDRYLGHRNVFRQAAGLTRVGIAVRYSREDEEKERTLNITISGGKSCNLQSLPDPEDRRLGHALLADWGILDAFYRLDAAELRAILPALLDLFDGQDIDVTAHRLADLGLDPQQLIRGGLLERAERQDVVVIDDDVSETAPGLSGRPDMQRLTGAFGEDQGLTQASETEMFRLREDWLRDTIATVAAPLLTKRMRHTLTQDLDLIGALEVDGREVPVMLARRLGDPRLVSKLDELLRGSDAETGVILAPSAPIRHLGRNVVIAIGDHLAAPPTLSLEQESVALAFRMHRSAAAGGAAVSLDAHGETSATLHVPGKPPLALTTPIQILLFRRFVEAHRAGAPDVRTGVLMKDIGSKSPSQAFRAKAWKTINGVYIEKSAAIRGWRLCV